MREAKIQKINRNINTFLANASVRVQSSEPFSRRVSPYQELIDKVEDFTNQNLVSLGKFLYNSPEKARGYYNKCENLLQELQKREIEVKKDFSGPEVDILLGKLKSLRTWLVNKF